MAWAPKRPLGPEPSRGRGIRGVVRAPQRARGRGLMLRASPERQSGPSGASPGSRGVAGAPGRRSLGRAGASRGRGLRRAGRSRVYTGPRGVRAVSPAPAARPRGPASGEWTRGGGGGGPRGQLAPRVGGCRGSAGLQVPGPALRSPFGRGPLSSWGAPNPHPPPPSRGHRRPVTDPARPRGPRAASLARAPLARAITGPRPR